MRETIHINPDFPEDFSSINDIYEALEITKPRFSGFARLKSMDVYVKSSSPISFKRRLKKAPRSTGPWRSAPRIREYRNLLKLRERGFPAARPLIAAEKRVFGFLERQLLVTERVSNSASLFDLAVQGKLEQDQLLAINWRLGCLVGRMHNAGFCHRDLFMRNIVVGLNGAEPSLHFIDCHQGSWSQFPGRAFAYDLGCYEKWAATLFDGKTRAHFFAGYFKERPGEDLKKLLRLTNQARQRLVLRRQKRKREIHKKKQTLDPRLTSEPLDPTLICRLLSSKSSEALHHVVGCLDKQRI
jgi:tRNA A-37 threonylcarbamoyl transferase component Bud32